MNEDYFSLLKTDSKSNIKTKIRLIWAQDCPYCLPADTWCDNSVQWPEMEYRDICDYLTHSISLKEQNSF